MKKFFRILLAIITLSVAYCFPINEAQATVEDYTTFTEFDPYGEITKGAYHLGLWGISNDVSKQAIERHLATGEIPASSDIICEWTANATGFFSGAGSAEVFTGLGTTNYSAGGWAVAGEYSIGMVSSGAAGQLTETWNGTAYTTATHAMPIGTAYYMRLSRDIGNNLVKLYWYSDVNRTVMVYSDNLTLHGSPAYSYLYAVLVGINAPGTTWLGMYIDNFQTWLLSGTVLTITTGGYGTSLSWDYAQLSGVINTLGVAGNVTQWGIQYGTSTGNYTTNLTESGSHGVGGYYENTSPLTSGTTYYYRAHAYDGTWVYGNEYTFTMLSAPSISFASATYVPGYDVVFAGWISSFNGSGNITDYGFQFGLSPGNYTLFAPDRVGSGGVVIDGTDSIGQRTALYHGILSENVTYYVRFFVDNNVGRTYSAEASFINGVTISAPISVTTDGASVNGCIVQAGTITFAGTIVSSPIPIIKRGFYYGTSNTSLIYTLQELSSSFSFESFTMSIPTTEVAGQTVFYEAYAVGYNDVTMMVGVGSIKSILVPPAPTATALGTIITDGSIISGALVLLKGNITSTGSASILARGFQWSLYAQTNNTTGSLIGDASMGLSGLVYAWSEDAGINDVPFPIPTGKFSATISMAPNTTFYWQAGIYDANGWKWTTTGDFFTTGATGEITTIGAPVVITLAPTSGSITMTSFEANEQLTQIGAGYVNSMGFDYRLDETQVWISLLPTTGNFSLGIYSSTLSGFSAGQTVYFRARCTSNTTLSSVGQSWTVIMATDTKSGTSTSDTNVISDWVLNLARYQGLDNPMGHWAFMLETMLAILLFFGILMGCLFLRHVDKLVITIVAWILLVTEVVDVLMFVFTLWLGIWPLIIGASIVLLVVFILIAMANARGN
jgi:hypothetical protein